MSDELRPCPFCNGELHVAGATPGGRVRHLVYCKSCKCSSGPAHASKAKAIAAWNHRPVEDELRAENQRLREALARIRTESSDNWSSAVADDALEPKAMVLSQETKR